MKLGRICLQTMNEEDMNGDSKSGDTNEHLEDTNEVEIAVETSTNNLADARINRGISHKKVKKVIILTKYEQKIRKRLRNLSKQISKYEKWHDKVRLSLKVARKFMGTTKLVKVVENLSYILKVKDRKKYSRETYTIQQKIIALLVMRKSVAAYKLLCKMFFLPPPRTLLTFLRLNSQQKVKTFYMDTLEDKAQKLMNKVTLHCMLLRAANKLRSANLLQKADLYCLLLFREFNLKIHMNSNLKIDFQSSISKKNGINYADHCLIFMIRGIWEDLYKLPVAYLFYKGQATAHELANMIKEEINRLQKALFIPVATICNEEGNNQKALKLLVSETKAYFEAKSELLEENVFYVNGKKVVPLYDPPQLMLSMRNHFMKKNIIFEYKGEVQTAQWKHLEEFYQEHQAMKLNLHKLTRELVYPRGNAMRKPQLALQTFCHTIAAFMAFSSGLVKESTPIISRECVETAHLLKFFDDLFDSVNGSRKQSKYDEHKPLLRKVKLKSVHRRAWAESLQTLKTMKFVDKSGKEVKVATIVNWIWTIEGYKALMKHLFFNTVIDGVWMRWFNQDPLNEVFKDYCDDRFLDAKKYSGQY